MRDHIVLIVNHDKLTLKSIKRALRKESYDIIAVESEAEALWILSHCSVNLVITGHFLENGCGLDFLKKVQKIKPNTGRVVYSGYTDDAVIESYRKAVIDGEIHHYIIKPCEPDTLKTFIGSFIQDRHKHNQTQPLSLSYN